VVSAASFPSSPQFKIQIDCELMMVTALSGTGNTTWTVTRGIEGTTPTTHALGATVTGVLTAGDMNAIAAVVLAPQGANTVLAGPSSGSSGPPGYRALMTADIPNLPSSQITSGWPWTVPQGGTGDTSLAAHAVLLGEGTSPLGTAAPGPSGQALLSQGTTSDPAFQTISGDATITGTGVVTVAKVDGVAYPASPSTNTVPVVTSTNQVTYEAVPNAALANSSVNVDTGTGLTGGGNVALGGTITISASNIPNSALANSSITISSGALLSGGGTVALGGSLTLSVNLTGISGYNSSVTQVLGHDASGNLMWFNAASC
jgi:hypothetical protein